MNKDVTTISLFAFSTALMVYQLTFAAVYGSDDRQDVVTVGNQQVKAAAKSTAIMIANTLISERPNATIDLDFQPLSTTFGSNVCTDQKFHNQISAGVACTGFLIGQDLMVTAGHCMINVGEVKQGLTPFCTEFSWLFDFQNNTQGQASIKGLSKDRLYRCQKVLYAKNTTTYNSATQKFDFDDDFAIIQLDRPVPNRSPLKLAGPLAAIGQGVSSIGYPNGIPMKYMNNGKVLDQPNSKYFRTTLDMFEGNSGGPIFNAAFDVIGIEVRGFPADFIWSPQRQCNVVNKCNGMAQSCQLADEKESAGEHAFPANLIRERAAEVGLSL